MTDIRATDVQTPALVYVRNARGTAEAQKWWQPMADYSGYWRGKILAWHRLESEEAGLPFYKLAEIYPPPPVVREAKVKL